MGSQLISLCMIVKNEEKNIKRCLDSVKELVDEIIIVDTGSTDNTIWIAKKCGAKVIRRKWKNDFSLARNVGVKAARGKWILFLDADEALEPTVAEKVRGYAETYDEGVFMFQVASYTDETCNDTYTLPTVRMFLNHPNHRFRGKIHEQIMDSIIEENKHTLIYSTPVKIYHYGYTAEILASKVKYERNMKLLLEAHQAEPHKAIYLYHIGMEYYAIKDYPRAYTYFSLSHELVKDDESYIFLIYIRRAVCLYKLNRIEEALVLCEEGIGGFPDYTDLIHLFASLNLGVGKNEQARIYYEKAIALGPMDHYENEAGVGTYKTYFALGLVNEADGKYDDALCCYCKSLEGNWNQGIIAEAIIRTFYRQENRLGINIFLKQLFNIDDFTNDEQMIVFLERVEGEAKTPFEVKKYV